MKKFLMVCALALNTFPVLGQDSHPNSVYPSQSDRRSWSFLPGKKMLFGLGVLGAVGLAAAYCKGSSILPKINYSVWVGYLNQLGKDPLALSVSTGISILGGMCLQKRLVISWFMRELKRKIDTHEEITLKWSYQNLPLVKAEDTKIALDIHFKSSNLMMPPETRRELALRPTMPWIKPCRYIGICELAKWYGETEDNEDKRIIEQALNEKIKDLEHYLYRYY